MIIYGYAPKTIEVDHGKFLCPVCVREELYTKMVIKRYFTLYFIKIFPIDIMLTYIKCGLCGGEFKEEVLELSKEIEREIDQNLSDLSNAVLYALISIAQADGRITDFEVKKIQEISMAIFKQSIDKENIIELSKDVMLYQKTVTILKRIAQHIPHKQKALVVLAMTFVAISDNEFSPQELRSITQFGSLLGILPMEINSIIAGITELSSGNKQF